MKWLKRALLAFVALVLVLVGGVLVRFYLLAPKYRPAQEVTAPSTPEAIERGRYLANSVVLCMSCHSQADESLPGDPMVAGRLGSGRVLPLPGFPGHVRAHNLTPDKETGLGQWTDGEILRAMREGVGRDGHPLFPMMPFATLGRNLSDDDALAIIAYLRSIPPIHNDPGATELDFPISMLVRAGPAVVEKGAPAAPIDPLKRGQWLLTVANCGSCHDSHDGQHEPIPGRHFAGGDPFPIPGGGMLYAANITSDPATGIGAYSDDDLMRVLREGINKGGRPLKYMPFPWYREMSEDDRKALILALRSVPPVSNMVLAADPTAHR